MAKQVRQYGTWKSSISPKSVASGLRLSDVQWDTDGGTLVWLEGRGAQGVLVAQGRGDASRDLTEGEFSVRAKVGYGGGDYTVSGGSVYFAGGDGRLYRQSLSGGGPRPITPAFGHAAAPRVAPNGHWLVYVHSYERVDGLVLVDIEGQLWPQKLIFGTDFVMQPAWHPDGMRLAYVAWDHPNMPWDGTELRVASFECDSRGIPFVVSTETVAGDDKTAIFQPEFSPDGRYMAYISDKAGWTQLYVYDLKQQTHAQLTTIEAEHGRPGWVQGLRTYGWTHDGKALYYLLNDKGFQSLWRYDVSAGKSQRIDAFDEYTDLSQIAVSPTEEAVAVIASSSTLPARVVTYRPTNKTQVERRSSGENIPEGELAAAQAITWKGHDGGTVHGLYYPPTNDRYEGTGRPPLIVNVHGGPTSQVTAGFSADTQFFTSRGFAVLQVNYRGGTGYGKAYMNMLRGNWGIYDVEDSMTGAQHLVDQGLADGSKLVIKGGSAGGFTVLQSLVTKPGFYKAGVCLYGVSNQFLLALETHKFEERYTDSLLGPLPEAADLYRERSPMFHAEKIVDPLIIYQGAEDVVVLRNQSDLIVDSLKARGVTHEYHVYEGEGHGFRRPETLEHFYTTLMKFLTQHVLFA